MQPDETFFEYQKQIVRLIAGLMTKKGITQKSANIYAWMYVKGDLTQKKLRNITSLSAGSVSNGLQRLERLGVIKKERDSGSRKYHYRLSGTMKHAGIKMMRDNIYLVQQRMQLFQYILDELEKPSLIGKDGREKMVENIRPICNIFPLYWKIITQVIDELVESVPGMKKRKEDKRNQEELELPNINFKELKNLDPQGFSPEVFQVEFVLRKYFEEVIPEFSGANPVITSILSYFYSRGNLTQSELRAISGFSAGAVSEALKKIVEMGMVEKKRIPGTHEYRYYLGSFKSAIGRFTNQYTRNVEIVREQLEEILKNLKSEKFDNIGERDMLASVTSQIMDLFEIFPKINKMLEEMGE